MRIALLTTQWPGVRLGGIGAYTVYCARALAKAGHEVHIFTFTLPGDAEQTFPPGVIIYTVRTLAEAVTKKLIPPNGVTALQQGGEGTYRLASATLLCDEVRRMHAKIHFDIVEGSEYEALTLPLVAMPLEDAALITHIHSGSAIARLFNNTPLDAEQVLRERLERLALCGSDGICAPTNFAVTQTRAAMGDIPVTPQVISLPCEISVSPHVFSPALGWGSVLYLGRVEKLKGAHLLPITANIFLKQYPRATLRIAGPDTATAPADGGSMTQWIRNRLSPDIATRVVFLGELNRDQINAELAACSLVVIPSLSETFSYVCVEALAAGRGVVVTEGIGAAEVAGDAGETFRRDDGADLAHVLGRIWQSPDYTMLLSMKANKRAQSVLSAKSVIEQRIIFYQSVIDRTRSLKAVSRVSQIVEELGGSSVPAVIPLLLRLGIAGLNDDAVSNELQSPAGLTQSPGTLLLQLLTRHAEKSGDPHIRFHLFGAGRYTARLLVEKHLWENQGHRLVGLIDDHPRYATPSAEYLGIKVQPLKAAEFTLHPADLVILSTDTFIDQFWSQTAPLRAKGITVLPLYS